MPYEIKRKNDQYYVVDTANQKIRGGPYDSEDKAEDRQDELDFRETVRNRMSRMPVTEMTAEEKAAAYDKMMAEKEKDPKIPPKKEGDPPTDPPKKKSLYWGELDET
jgi:hypothetical protein